MSKFAVGDRVRHVSCIDGNKNRPVRGTVKNLENDRLRIQWDDNRSGVTTCEYTHDIKKLKTPNTAQKLAEFETRLKALESRVNELESAKNVGQGATGILFDTNAYEQGWNSALERVISKISGHTVYQSNHYYVGIIREELKK